MEMTVRREMEALIKMALVSKFHPKMTALLRYRSVVAE
jgi:hypothetical protein